MDPLTMGLIGGGASLLGSLFSSNTSAQNTQAQIQAQQQMQQETEAFNAQQADINRQFQSNQVLGAEVYNSAMSNTAYQRASQDMKSAGLNPMMMFGSGGPASTPSAPTASGSTASVGTPSVPMPTKTSPWAGIGDAVSKVFSTASAVNNLQQQQADVDLKHAQKHNTDVNSLNTDVDTINKGVENDLLTQRKASSEMDNVIKKVNQYTTAKNVDAIDPTVRKGADIGAFLGQKAEDVIPVVGTVAKGVRKLVGSPQSRTTVETARDPNTGDSFSERFHY